MSYISLFVTTKQPHITEKFLFSDNNVYFWLIYGNGNFYITDQNYDAAIKIEGKLQAIHPEEAKKVILR